MTNATRELESLVTFLLGTEQYALPTDAVKSIIPITDVTYVPGAPDGVYGVINLRGDIIPVMGLYEGDGQSRPATETETLALVVELPDEASETSQIALLVDQVSHIAEMDLGALEDTGDLLISERRSTAVEGVLTTDAGPVLLLSPQRLIPGEEGTG